MDNKKATRQKLQEYLEGLKKAYGFSGQAFQLPDLETEEYYIALFDSLSEQQKIGFAKKFGITPDEYRKNLQGNSLIDDQKYSKISSSERVFYITVDLLMEDIEKAAKNWKLQAGKELIFGLLPTGEFNAVAIIPPNISGYIIAINYGTFLFLFYVGILFTRFLDKLYNGDKEYNENNSISQKTIEDCIDQRTNILFVDLILSYVHETFPGFTFSDTELVKDTLFDGGTVPAGRFMDTALSFILSHEYVHTCPIITSTIEKSREPNKKDMQSDKVVRNATEEFVADALGLRMSYYATTLRLAQGDISNVRSENLNNHLFASLVQAFLGAYSVLSCERVLSECVYSINGLKEFASTTHPPADMRIENLKQMLKQITDETSETSKDSNSIYNKVLQNVEIFDRFIDTLWKLKKERIILALSKLQRVDT